MFSPNEAASRFRDLLVELRLAGKLSAKHCGVLSYWAEQGRMVAPPEGSLSLSPTSQSGKFSVKFDKVLGLSKQMKGDWYTVRAPCYRRASLGRTCDDIEVCVPYQVIGDEIASLPHADTSLQEWIRSSQCPPCYHLNPWVKSSPSGTIWPLALYLDGVGFSKRDGVLGIWLINLVTSRRHCIVALKKRNCVVAAVSTGVLCGQFGGS